MRLYPQLPFVLLLLCLSVFEAAAQVNAPPDRDYFTAHEDPEAFRDLALNDLYHTNRVLHSFQVARYDEAIADLRFVLEKWPNHPRALLLIESLGQVTQALELPTPYYEKAIRLFPQYAMTFAQYGKYLVEIGQWDKGVENLKRAIEKDRKSVAAHVWLSQAYEQHGDKISAKKEAELARNLGFQGDFSPDLGQPSHRTKQK